LVTKASETVNREPFTVEVVMKHYFRPGREDFRQAILRAMPKMLGDGAPNSAKEEMRVKAQPICAVSGFGVKCDDCTW
jgi:hypothetical protein